MPFYIPHWIIHQLDVTPDELVQGVDLDHNDQVEDHERFTCLTRETFDEYESCLDQYLQNNQSALEHNEGFFQFFYESESASLFGSASLMHDIVYMEYMTGRFEVNEFEQEYQIMDQILDQAVSNYEQSLMDGEDESCRRALLGGYEVLQDRQYLFSAYGNMLFVEQLPRHRGRLNCMLTGVIEYMLARRIDCEVELIGITDLMGHVYVRGFNEDETTYNLDLGEQNTDEFYLRDFLVSPSYRQINELDYYQIIAYLYNNTALIFEDTESLKLNFLQTARVLYPEDAIILDNIAIYYILNHRENEALEVLERANSLNSNDLNILFDLALLYHHQQRFFLALMHISNAIDLLRNKIIRSHVVAPNEYRMLMFFYELKSNIYQENKRQLLNNGIDSVEETEEIQVVENNIEEVNTYIERYGSILREFNCYSDAIDNNNFQMALYCLDNAIRLDPENYINFMILKEQVITDAYLLVLGENNNDLNNMAESLEASLTGSFNLLAHKLLVRNYIAQQNYQAAKNHALIALDIDPTCFSSYIYLGIANFKLGNIEQSIDNFHMALSFHIEDSQTHSLLGGVYSSIGEDYQAMYHFQLAAQYSYLSENFRSQNEVASLFSYLDLIGYNTEGLTFFREDIALLSDIAFMSMHPLYLSDEQEINSATIFNE